MAASAKEGAREEAAEEVGGPERGATRRDVATRGNFEEQFCLAKKRGGVAMTVYGVNRESTTLRCSPGEGGDWRETEEERVVTSIRGSTCSRVRATLGVSALRVSRP